MITVLMGLCLQQVYFTPMKSYRVNDGSYDDSEQAINTSSTQVTLTGLYAASTYTIYVRAVNEIGAGASSGIVTRQIPATGEERERERERVGERKRQRERETERKRDKSERVKHSIISCLFVHVDILTAPDSVPTMTTTVRQSVTLTLSRPSNVNGEIRCLNN